MEEIKKINGELSQALKIIENAGSKIAILTKTIEEKEKTWRELQDKIDKEIAKAKGKIKLDVGGQLFTCSKGNLLKYENTYFYGMLSSGKWQPDEDGTYFIDRNPKYFPYILDFFRTDDISVEELSELEIKKLLDEVDYYQIKVLKQKIQSNFNKIYEIFQFKTFQF